MGERADAGAAGGSGQVKRKATFAEASKTVPMRRLKMGKWAPKMEDVIAGLTASWPPSHDRDPDPPQPAKPAPGGKPAVAGSLPFMGGMVPDPFGKKH